MIVFVLILDWGNGDEEVEGVYPTYRAAEQSFIKYVKENPSRFNPPHCEIREFKVEY